MKSQTQQTGGREGNEREREAGGQGPPHAATPAPLSSHRGKVLSPPGSGHWGERIRRPEKGQLGRGGGGPGSSI